MTFPLSSRTTQTSNPSRSTVIDFEPLLDATEAAALLRMHPNTLRLKARLGEIPGRHIGKYWRFRVSDLNDWVRHQVRGDYGATNPMGTSAAHSIDASAG
jgi:excisionase family DNA binding protein